MSESRFSVQQVVSHFLFQSHQQVATCPWSGAADQLFSIVTLHLHLHLHLLNFMDSCCCSWCLQQVFCFLSACLLYYGHSLLFTLQHSHTYWGIFPGNFCTFNLHFVAKKLQKKIAKAAAVRQWLRTEWSLLLSSSGRRPVVTDQLWDSTASSFSGMWHLISTTLPGF